MVKEFNVLKMHCSKWDEIKLSNALVDHNILPRCEQIRTGYLRKFGFVKIEELSEDETMSENEDNNDGTILNNDVVVYKSNDPELEKKGILDSVKRNGEVFRELDCCRIDNHLYVILFIFYNKDGVFFRVRRMGQNSAPFSAAFGIVTFSKHPVENVTTYQVMRQKEMQKM